MKIEIRTFNDLKQKKRFIKKSLQLMLEILKESTHERISGVFWSENYSMLYDGLCHLNGIISTSRNEELKAKVPYYDFWDVKDFLCSNKPKDALGVIYWFTEVVKDFEKAKAERIEFLEQLIKGL